MYEFELRTNERLSEVNQELEKAKKAAEEAFHIAEEANQSKSRFLSNMSHDMRTPMNAIVGFTTLLDNESKNSEKVQEYTKKIAFSSQHLLGLINDVLDMSKIEAGKMKLTLEEENMDEIIENIDALVRPQMVLRRQKFEIIVELLKEIPEKVQYVITNEAGASVYSASKLATEEFPNFDVGQRSAASIARRLQDPLAELVKITPQSIGVGQYQHDMNQKKLSEALSGVVEDCVNKVGVDLNTASAPLLSYISGISGAIAKNIVAYREENGRFTDRKQLLKVAKLGPKAFEQCAGFMRIQNGTNPLDGTSVHPESYEAAEKLLKKQGFSLEDISGGKLTGLSLTIKDYARLAKELEIGEITLRDIVKELEKPGRDPRDEMPKPILRTDVLDMKDLKEGMILKGTVRNVIDFGVFVDIGVHQDGLVHISEITDKKFIKHPLEVVSVGDIVDVKVMSVDLKKKRIQLTMKIDHNK